MSPAKSVPDAEAELAQAEADLAAAEQAEAQPVEDKSVVEKVADVVAPVKEDQPAPVPAREKTTEELLAAAPPLVMPAGQSIIKVCTKCGLKLQDPPPNLTCPNCGNVVP